MDTDQVDPNADQAPPVRPSDRVRRIRTAELLQVAQSARNRDQRQQALTEIIVLNMDVARSIAASYSGRGVPSEDLEQVAYVALVRAAYNFDPDRADDFLAYAVPTVRGEVKKYFRDHGWVIRPPRRLQELQAQIADSRWRLQQHLLREPTVPEIADEVGVEPDAIEEALRADSCYAPTSLDRPVTSGATTALGDLLAAQLSELDAAEARLMLWPVIGLLSPRDRKILRLRFWDGWTEQEIGKELGVSQMQISRLLKRILVDLRRAMSGNQVDADTA